MAMEHTAFRLAGVRIDRLLCSAFTFGCELFHSPIGVRNGLMAGSRFWDGLFQPGNKVDHIAVHAAAETVETSVHLYAEGLVVMEGASAHPVSAHSDAATLGGLPVGTDRWTSSKILK